MREATREQFIEVDEIGDRIAESLIDYFSDHRNILLIDRLRSQGLHFESQNKITITNSLFENKNLLFPGCSKLLPERI